MMTLHEQDSSNTVTKYFAKRSGKSSTGLSKLSFKMYVKALISSLADALIIYSFFSTSLITSFMKIRLSILYSNVGLVFNNLICSTISSDCTTEVNDLSKFVADDSSDCLAFDSSS